MKKKMLIFLLFFFLTVSHSFAVGDDDPITLSVIDFEVQSGDASHRFIGKGFSSLITTELRKSTTLRLTEREQINRILEEQKLQLSGLTDGAVVIGNMLSVDYMLTGNIIDMKDSFIFEARLINVETGEILWNETIVEKLNEYEFVSTALSVSLLRYLDLKPAATTAAAAERPKPRDEEIILNLSRGIDEIDKGNDEKARNFLKTAERLDPANETVRYFLGKLTRRSSRFKIMAEPNYSYGNPAKLGLIGKDTLFFSSAFLPLGLYSNDDSFTNEYLNYVYVTDLDQSFSINESKINLGYNFPLLAKGGMQIEAFHFSSSEAEYTGEIADVDALQDYSPSYLVRNGWGGVISFGYEITPMFGAGIGFGIYHGQGEREVATESSTNYSLTAGILLSNPAKTLSFDSVFGYNSGTLWIRDRLGDSSSSSVLIPMYNENTGSFTLTEDLLLVMKQRNVFRIEEEYYQGTLNPSIEFFTIEQFSLRGGVEGSYTHINGEDILGWGLLFGTSYQWKNSGAGIDINISYRQGPALSLGEILLPELVINSELYLEGLFVKKR